MQLHLHIDFKAKRGRCLDRLNFDWIADTIEHLKEKAPFAEIRRSARAIYKEHQEV